MEKKFNNEVAKKSIVLKTIATILVLDLVFLASTWCIGTLVDEATVTNTWGAHKTLPIVWNFATGYFFTLIVMLPLLTGISIHLMMDDMFAGSAPLCYWASRLILLMGFEACYKWNDSGRIFLIVFLVLSIIMIISTWKLIRGKNIVMNKYQLNY